MSAKFIPNPCPFPINPTSPLTLSLPVYLWYPTSTFSVKAAVVALRSVTQFIGPDHLKIASRWANSYRSSNLTLPSTLGTTGRSAAGPAATLLQRKTAPLACQNQRLTGHTYWFHGSNAWSLADFQLRTSFRLLGSLPTRRLSLGLYPLMPAAGDVTNFGKRVRRRRRYRPRTVLASASKRARLFRTFLARKVSLVSGALSPVVSSVRVSNRLGKAVRVRRPRIKLKPYRFLGVKYFRKTLGQTTPRLLLNTFKRFYRLRRPKNLRPRVGATRPILTPRTRRARSRRKWRFRRTLPRKLKVRSVRKLYSKARKLSRAHRRAARAPSYRSQWALRRQSLGKSLLSAKSLSGMNSLRVSQPPHQRFLSQQCASLTRSSPPQRLRNPAFPPRLNAGAFHSEPRPNYVPLVNLPPTNPLPALAARVSGVDVAPLYSRTFRRSPFFFVNLVTLPSPSSLDLLTSTRQFAPRFKHHLFPSANYLKTEIFRKLNRQKSLASARALSFNSPFSARGEQSYSFRSRRDFRIRPTAANPLLGTARGALLGLHRLRLAPTLTGLRWKRNPSPSVKRIQFKPGYGRTWRTARNSIRELLNLPSRYQYRLTPKLHWQYMTRRKHNWLYSSIGLDYLLMFSRLVPDFWSVQEVISNHSVFLNGVSATNSNTHVFVNDLVQLTINLKFYIASKWLKSWSVTKRNRVNKIYYQKYRPSGTNRHVKFVRTLPTWFFDLQFSHCDVPKYIEVDFFTLSAFVVHDKLPLETWTPSRANLYNPSSTNMYNWKYIT